MRKRELPKTMDVLKALPYSERAKLWAKYSPHPFKRQNRSLWYYIQCDRFGIENREKALGQNQTLQRKSIRVAGPKDFRTSFHLVGPSSTTAWHPTQHPVPP